ncbi:MAG TPA: hypothetical protein VK618_08670 [Flavitalea sp.]|nr:hypothetical protein [Flavitalea sp.]
MSPKLKNWLQSLRPGIITAALVFGSSKMTITSKLGSEYEFSLLWMILLTVLFIFSENAKTLFFNS